jgi:hypothetical protein
VGRAHGFASSPFDEFASIEDEEVYETAVVVESPRKQDLSVPEWFAVLLTMV